jgi:hypothetical protein
MVVESDNWVAWSWTASIPSCPYCGKQLANSSNSKSGERWAIMDIMRVAKLHKIKWCEFSDLETKRVFNVKMIVKVTNNDVQKTSFEEHKIYV